MGGRSVETEELGESLRQVETEIDDMRTTPIDELVIGAHMKALATMFEGQPLANPGIRYQAVLGWDEEQVGELCRLIDAADADGVLAFFDPKAIESGPIHVGVCIRDSGAVRLEIGNLWIGKDGRTALVAKDGRSYLAVEHGRFVEHKDKPVQDLTHGVERFRRRLANLVAPQVETDIIIVSVR